MNENLTFSHSILLIQDETEVKKDEFEPKSAKMNGITYILLLYNYILSGNSLQYYKLKLSLIIFPI